MLGLGLIQLFIKARQNLTFITLTSFTISSSGTQLTDQRMLVVANQISYVKGYKT